MTLDYAQTLNLKLNRAKYVQKYDEFFTQLPDIESEIQHYINHNPDVFRDKTVFLPADNSESHFAIYFTQNFDKLGLRDLFISSDDFRSATPTRLKDRSDIIITNPPFSLFRHFMQWINPIRKKCLVLGNVNALTYKYIFPLIMQDHLHLGVNRGSMEFRVPQFLNNISERDRRTENGINYIKMRSIRWYTNLPHGFTPPPLTLYPASQPFEHYDNYNAIEIPRTKLIPSDYHGVMGVPITFMDKYNPAQFELLGHSVRENPAINGKETYQRIFIKHKK